MLNNNTQASVGLHNTSNIETSIHTNAELAPKSDSSQSKSMMDKVKDAASHLGEQMTSVGNKIGTAIQNMGNNETKLQPILNNVQVVTPNELNDIPAHNQTEKPHWTSHPHTHDVSNSGLLNQAAFVGEIGTNILDKESEKHGVNPSDKVHFDAHPHTHDVSNSGVLNQGAFVGQVGTNILAKESEKHGVNPSDKVRFDPHPHTHDVSNSGALNQTDVSANVRDADKPHWPVHSMPSDATLSQDVYAQGSAPSQSGFVTHPDHSGAHAGIFDKVGSEQLNKQSELEQQKNTASHSVSNLLEQGKEKLGQLGDKIGEMGDKVKAAIDPSSSDYVNPELSTSASANVNLTH